MASCVSAKSLWYLWKISRRRARLAYSTLSASRTPTVSSRRSPLVNSSSASSARRASSPSPLRTAHALLWHWPTRPSSDSEHFIAPLHFGQANAVKQSLLFSCSSSLGETRERRLGGATGQTIRYPSTDTNFGPYLYSHALGWAYRPAEQKLDREDTWSPILFHYTNNQITSHKRFRKSWSYTVCVFMVHSRLSPFSDCSQCLMQLSRALCLRVPFLSIPSVYDLQAGVTLTHISA